MIGVKTSALTLADGMIESMSFKDRDIPTYYALTTSAGIGGSLSTGLFSVSLRQTDISPLSYMSGSR